MGRVPVGGLGGVALFVGANCGSVEMHRRSEHIPLRWYVKRAARSADLDMCSMMLKGLED